MVTGAIAWFGELRLLAIAPETVRGALGEATAAVDGTEDSGEEDGGTAVKAGFSDIVGGIGAGVTDVRPKIASFWNSYSAISCLMRAALCADSARLPTRSL